MSWGFEHHYHLYLDIPLLPILCFVFLLTLGHPKTVDDGSSYDPDCLARVPHVLCSPSSLVSPVLTASSCAKNFPLVQPARRVHAASLSRQVAKRTQQNAFKSSGDQKSDCKNHINPQEPGHSCLSLVLLSTSSLCDMRKGECESRWVGGCKSACAFPCM